MHELGKGLTESGEVDVPFADLQSFAVYALGIGDMGMGGMGPDFFEKFRERFVEMGAS